MNKENKTFLVLGAFQSGKSELIKLFGSDAEEFNKFPITKYEFMYNITVHSRPFSYLFRDGNIITFIDTPGHCDYIDEALVLLKILNDVILVLTLEENVESLYFDILPSLRNKNVYLFLNKMDVSIGNLQRDIIYKIIENIKIDYKKVYLCSAREKWIFEFNPNNCKINQLKMIYNYSRTKMKFEMKKFKISNSFLFQVKRFLTNDNLQNNCVYAFKKYFIEGEFFILVFSKKVFTKGEIFKSNKIKKIIVDGIEVEKSLRDVPAFITFEKQIENNTLLEGETRNHINSPLIYKVNLSNDDDIVFLSKYKSMYLNIEIKNDCIYVSNELTLDSFLTDVYQLENKLIKIKDFGLKEKRLIVQRREKEIKVKDQNTFIFKIEEIMPKNSKLIVEVNNIFLYNNLPKEIEPMILISLKKAFTFLFNDLEVIKNDKVIPLYISLESYRIVENKSNDFYNEIKHSLEEELNLITCQLQENFLYKIFYEDLVHDIVYNEVKVIEHYKIENSIFNVILCHISAKDVFGFENYLYHKTLGRIFCIKKCLIK